MGALREKMIEEMKLRNFSPRTQQAYTGAMIALVKHYRRSPDQLSQDEIRAYLLHLQERGLSASSRNVAISGMKFFYHQILGWNEKQLFIPPRKRSWQLPEVLSQKEVERLVLATTKQPDRCLLMTAYASGLRVSELVRLKLSAIDSHRMMIRVEQGKGQKDRYTILSQQLLLQLRSYWKEHRSPVYVFPNRKGGPISIDYAQAFAHPPVSGYLIFSQFHSPQPLNPHSRYVPAAPRFSPTRFIPTLLLPDLSAP